MISSCDECHQEVSETAPTCPHCGYQFQQPVRNFLVALMWLIHLVAIGCIALIYVKYGSYTSGIYVMAEIVVFWIAATAVLGIGVWTSRKRKH